MLPLPKSFEGKAQMGAQPGRPAPLGVSLRYLMDLESKRLAEARRMPGRPSEQSTTRMMYKYTEYTEHQTSPNKLVSAFDASQSRRELGSGIPDLSSQSQGCFSAA